MKEVNEVPVLSVADVTKKTGKPKCTVSCDGHFVRRLKLTNCGTQKKMKITMYNE